MAQVRSLNAEAPLRESNPNQPIRLKELGAENPVVKTHGIGPAVIGSTDLPGQSAFLDADKISLPPYRAAAVDDLASEVGVSVPKRWPDFTLGVIKVAAAREAVGSEKLQNLAAQVREQLGDIDLLLDLSSELTSLPDKDSHELNGKMRGLIGKLELHKIQVWKGDGKISKDKLGEFKAQISSQIDKLRTALQTKISTEIQPEANNLQAIMNIVQQIIQSDARLKRKTAEIPR
jgi:hypothetical protein